MWRHQNKTPKRNFLPTSSKSNWLPDNCTSGTLLFYWIPVKVLRAFNYGKRQLNKSLSTCQEFLNFVTLGIVSVWVSFKIKFWLSIPPIPMFRTHNTNLNIFTDAIPWAPLLPQPTIPNASLTQFRVTTTTLLRITATQFRVGLSKKLLNNLRKIWGGFPEPNQSNRFVDLNFISWWLRLTYSWRYSHDWTLIPSWEKNSKNTIL